MELSGGFVEDEEEDYWRKSGGKPGGFRLLAQPQRYQDEELLVDVAL
jgi:hypothetical protein